MNKKPRKKGAAAPFTICFNLGGQTFFKGLLSELPVNETVLIAKSIEFFSDPEPCFIHRSAVQARMYAEFEQWLAASYGAADEYNVEMSELPPRFSGYFFDQYNSNV